MQNALRPTGQKTKKASHRYFVLIASALLILSGCAAQGARRIPADRFDYNAAIARSTREQMLLNIVRSRYMEVPVFLTVSSVLTILFRLQAPTPSGAAPILTLPTG
jgi:hypothetical protein